MRGRKKLRVGVLFGGRSSEHEISLRSALTVISALDPARYAVIPIGITRDGRWYLRDDALAYLRVAAPKLRALNRAGLPINLPPYPGGFHLVATARAKTRGHQARQEAIATPDVIFPVLHGTYGEDGTIQGLLELAGIAYVGAGVLGSAIGMDKEIQKRLLRDAGLPVVRFHALTRSAYEEDSRLPIRLADDLGYPLFVKPNTLGSSVGISRVAERKSLAAALDEAFQYDRKVLLEAACPGREFECAVLGNDRPEASLPGEVIVRGGHEFYSYESKYVDPDGATIQVPAELPHDVRERIRECAVAAFGTLGLRGMARVDFLANHDLSELYINEVNTIPGFTTISMYPRMWEASGLSLPRLIDRLIELALEDHDARSRLKYSYLPDSKRL
ncbi:MAG TPA: D-alanine--D-alanine ligase family protein [Candidatus Binataceae bacterium]|nr:D-alanine--D-alanine ligase family protein [Candidatus Binataceae bacterium]